MATISHLVVKISADGAKLRNQLKKSAMTVKKWSASAAKSVAKVAAVFSALGIASLGGFIISVNRSADAINKLAKTSSKLGIGISALQEFHYAAQQSGVKIDSFNMALQRMVRRIAEASIGTGEAKDALKELGQDAVKLGKMTPDEQLMALSKAMADVSDQGHRVRLAMKLFDSEGVALVNLMTADIMKLRQEYRDLGVGITAAQAKAVEAFSDSKTKLSKIFSGFTNNVTAEVAPALELINNKLVAFIKKAGGVRVVAKKFALAIVQGIKASVQAVSSFIRQINELRIDFIDLTAQAKTFWHAAKAFATGGVSLLDGGEFERELMALSDERLEVMLSLANKSEIQKDLDNLAKDIELTFNQKDKTDEKEDEKEIVVGNVNTDLKNLATSSMEAAKNLKDIGTSKAWQEIFKKTDVTARSFRFDDAARLAKQQIDSGSKFAGSSLNDLSGILQTVKNNSGRGFSNNNLFEQVDIAGMAEVVKGLQALANVKAVEPDRADQIQGLIRRGEVSQNVIDKLIQTQQGQKTLGKLDIKMTTDTGKVAGQIFGEPAFLTNLKSFVDRQTNDSARAAAGG